MNNTPILNYAYDHNSNITHIFEDVQGGNNNDQHKYFEYDSLNRLSNAYTTGSSNGAFSEAMQYDALGNIVQKGSMTYGYGQASGIRGTGSNVHIHAVTHLNNAQQFSYDANGNMTTRIADGKTWTQTWTVENMLETATDQYGNDVTLVYDADGQLVLRKEGANPIAGVAAKRTVILADGLFEREYVGNSGGTPSKRYVFNGQTVAQRSASGVMFMVNDHLGGAIASMGASGGVSMVRRDAWGKEVWTYGTLLQGYSYLFTGQRWDELLGLYDYNARYYDPSNARFISVDVIVPDETNPQAYNRMTYVYNSPQKFADPSGHDPLDKQWRDEFEEQHGREAAWYDEWIRLFSLAYPDEYSESYFYGENGEYSEDDIIARIEGNGELSGIAGHPPPGRSWDTFGDALERLASHYSADEEASFMLDIGFLFGGLKPRSMMSLLERTFLPVNYFSDRWRTGPNDEKVGGPIVYLQPGNLHESFYIKPNGTQDGDANVHHYVAFLVMGYFLGFETAAGLNLAREIFVADQKGTDVDMSDVLIGTAGAAHGDIMKNDDDGPEALADLVRGMVG